MIIKDRLIEELVNLQGEIYSYLQKGDMSSKQLEILLRNIEKRRYNILNEIKLELSEVPNITDISKFSLKRDEKILEEIIKPKDELIKELYKDNLSLHKELSKQAKVINEAEKYQKERDKILADNQALHNQVENIKIEYKEKENYKYKIECKTCGQTFFRKRLSKNFTRKYRCGKCNGKFTIIEIN